MRYKIEDIDTMFHYCVRLANDELLIVKSDIDFDTLEDLREAVSTKKVEFGGKLVDIDIKGNFNYYQSRLLKFLETANHLGEWTLGMYRERIKNKKYDTVLIRLNP